MIELDERISVSGVHCVCAVVGIFIWFNQNFKPHKCINNSRTSAAYKVVLLL